MQTIQDRGYVWKKGNSLVPSFIAFAVVNLLEQHFAQLVDYDFTASLEEELDEIADGNLQRVDWLTEFYFGGEGRRQRRHRRVGRPQADRRPAAGGDRRPRRQLHPAAGHQHDGKPVVARVGRYGPYLQVDGDDGARVSIPEDLAPDELTSEKVAGAAGGAVQRPGAGHRPGVGPPGRGQGRPVRPVRHRPSIPEGSKDAPRTASLFSSMSPETVTLEDALRAADPAAHRGCRARTARRSRR